METEIKKSNSIYNGKLYKYNEKKYLNINLNKEINVSIMKILTY